MIVGIDFTETSVYFVVAVVTISFSLSDELYFVVCFDHVCFSVICPVPKQKRKTITNLHDKTRVFNV